MLNKITRPLKKLREEQELRNDLEAILATPHGQRFFKTFLRHCNVTRSSFNSDPYRIVEQEATRRLAMSYLHLLGRDDPQHLISMIEEETEHRQNPE